MNVKQPMIFAAGAAIGAGISWYISKRKYEKIVKDEVDSVIASFEDLRKNAQDQANKAKNKPPIDVYTEALNKSKTRPEIEAEYQEEKTNYTLYGNKTDDISEPKEASGKKTKENIEIITSNQFASEQPYFAKVNVHYYTDGTYADDHGEEMEIVDYIGRKMMDYVSDTDKDEICIRNYANEIDIDIIKEPMSYDEMMG